MAMSIRKRAPRRSIGYCDGGKSGLVSPAMRGYFQARTLVLLLLLCGLPKTAAADQPQDWVVAAGKKGTYVNLDFVFGAFQTSIEHRIPVYGATNMFTVRAVGLAALPYGSTQGDVELRLLNLTLGVSAGYQDVWRNQTFELGAPMHRKERREREAAGEFDSDGFAFWEGRAAVAFPFNDYVVFNQANTWRISGATERSFDNMVGVVDDGRWERSDFQLFFKHKTLGAIAPTFQILNFDLDNDWHTQFNYGFFLVTRAGLVQRDDLLIWQMMFHSGPIFGGGADNRDVYGMAVFRAPLTFLLAYRSVISL